MHSIEQACYWLATRPQTPFISLQGDHEVDVLVIGAGLTGLWSALFLKELQPQLEIAVVDQGCAAYGASGRNAGMLAETIDHTHELAVDHFGEEEARHLAQLGRDNINALRAFLEEHEIDCAFEPSGRLMVALSEAQNRAFEADKQVAEQLGITDYQLLTKEQTRAEISSHKYLGGLFVPSGGVLNPVKLVDGLRRVALSKGIQIYEYTKVTSLKDKKTHVQVNIENGSISARRVVMGTSAYTHQLLPRVSWRFIPLYDYIIVSEPLTQAQQALIGWKNRQGVSDGRNFFLYYRLTEDNRVLWGTSEAVYYGNNRVGPQYDHSEPHYQSLRASFAEHFPELQGLRFEYAWGGAICATTRMTPYFDSAFGGKLWYGLGFTGHGLGSTRLAGKILAHLSLSQPDELLQLQLATKKPFPYPPEPIRSLAVSWVTGDLRKLDEGLPPSLLLRFLEKFGIGFSS
jgi:glycine/D-amino acid oxidase-like deaminating enzyme